LLDAPENGSAASISHFDAHAIAEVQELSARRTAANLLDCTPLGDARVAGAAFADR
jgi:hypothetical protein